MSPACRSIRDLPGPWWVAHTRSRHEKALAVDLLAQQVPYFLPMVERTLVVRGRRFRGMLALFPGYVFFVGDASARYRALATSHVANVIPVVDQERFVNELAQIEQALVSPSGLDPFPYLKQGVRCRIKAGPLAGIQGIIVRRGGVTRLVLQIEMLGQAVATEIDPELLEPLD
ncbi:MAG TPA: transcription termination/antitermination NusG family protein [Phycisphaerae bacterium]|nr:transcription termination/antitermination NusG family protein [Phycisphaerae bacterium]HOM52908.1 transcription termination/antitermination NusG family protein [Phycisphaerae bacterium]HON66012.1 transcription termination/antitermination NusG family protein [Phycisphaerae bacterium]HOQ85745.1 transcription termination/antitermination NusG family protein [Phycisphaerae bacterium]HPP27108.1 transcription termination/antitermination NusG family protein [Phycisphaerae bacterium]